MGTEKYPDENMYTEFIKNNGGMSNAYTSLTSTNYQFECATEAFEEAADIFSQFFISPLMLKDSVDRELNAVHSEHQKNIQNDMWRFHQLLQSESSEGAALNRFGTGSMETLKKDSIREDLLEFHNKWYSSNIMKLCLYSNHTLDELEEIAKKLFSPIENKDVKVPSYEEPKPYQENNLGFLYKLKPVKEKNSLSFLVPIETCEKLHATRPAGYISHTLGHEGEGSLLSKLIKMDLATELMCYYDTELHSFSYILVSIDLTEKGLKNYEDVISTFFAYFKMMKEAGPSEDAFEEMKKSGELKWKFIEKSGVFRSVSSYSSRHQLFDESEVSKILESQYLYEKFDKEWIQRNISNISLPGTNVYFYSHHHSEETKLDQEEKWYKTKFSKEKFSEALLEKVENEGTEGMHLPNKNIFFPDSLEILEKNEEESSKVHKIRNDDTGLVYYKKDDQFETPKVYVNF